MRIFNIVFILRAIGAMEILFAISSLISNYNFSQNSNITKGVVIDFTENTFGDGDLFYAPIIKFKATDGELFEINSNYYTNWGVIQEGDSLNIAYKKNNPEDAKYLEGDSFYSSSFSNLIYGFIFIGLSFIAARFRKKIKGRFLQIKDQAEIAFLSIDASIKRVGVHTDEGKDLYFIEAEHNLNDTTKTYVSKYFYQDPTPYLNDIKTVTIKRKLFSNTYTMDTSFLPFD
jgi:hypothetical protein